MPIRKICEYLVKNDLNTSTSSTYLSLFAAFHSNFGCISSAGHPEVSQLLQASLYKISKAFEKHSHHVSPNPLLTDLFQIYTINLHILKGILLPANGLQPFAAQTIQLYHELCRLIINILGHLFEAAGPSVKLSLVAESIEQGCKLVYLILNLSISSPIQADADHLSYLLSLVCGVDIGRTKDSALFQFTVSYQIYLLRYHFVLLESNAQSQSKEAIQNCLELANIPGGLFCTVQAWNATCAQNVSSSYIRNIIRLYQRLSFLVSDSTSKICLLCISLKFIQSSDLSIEKELDYYLVTLNEIRNKAPHTSDTAVSEITECVFSFFEDKIVTYQAPLNWRWLHLFEYIAASTNSNKDRILKSLKSNSQHQLISFLPLISQFVFKMYLQLILFETSHCPALVFQCESSDSSMIDDSTAYLLSRFFSFFNSVSDDRYLKSILFALDSFLESSSLVRDHLSSPHHCQLLLKGTLIMTETLHSFLVKAPHCPDIQVVLQKLNLFFFRIANKDSSIDMCEGYFKRLLLVITKLYSASTVVPNLTSFLADVIFQNSCLANRILDNLDFSKSLSFCLIEELKISKEHLRFFIYSLSWITDFNLLEKLFFHASSISCSKISPNNPVILSGALQHLSLKMRKFLSAKHCNSTTLYLKMLMEYFDLNSSLYFEDKFIFTILFSYFLINLECNLSSFSSDTQRSAYCKALTYLLEIFHDNIKLPARDSFFQALFSFALCTVMIRIKKDESFVTIISTSAYKSCHVLLLEHLAAASEVRIPSKLDVLSDILQDLLALLIASFRLEGDSELSFLLFNCLKDTNCRNTLLFASIQGHINSECSATCNQQIENVFPFADRLEYFHPSTSCNHHDPDSLFSLLKCFAELSEKLSNSRHNDHAVNSRLIRLSNQWHRLAAFSSICYRISNIFLSLGDCRNALYFSKAGLTRETSVLLCQINFSTQYGGYLASQRELEFLFLIFKLDQLILGTANVNVGPIQWNRVVCPNFLSSDDTSALKKLYKTFGCFSTRRSQLFEDVFRFCVLLNLFSTNSDLTIKPASFLRLLNCIGYVFNGHSLSGTSLAPLDALHQTSSDDNCIYTVAMLKYYLSENTSIALPFSIEHLLSAFNSSSTFLVREASKFIFNYQFNVVRLSSYYIGLGIERSYSLLYSNVERNVGKSSALYLDSQSKDEFFVIMIKSTQTSDVILSLYETKKSLDLENLTPLLTFKRENGDYGLGINDFGDLISPHFSLDNAFDTWKSLMKENRSSAVGSSCSMSDPINTHPSASFSSGEWWIARQQLNAKIFSWLADFSILVFGIFPFLLPTFSYSDVDLEPLRQLLENIDLFISEFQLKVLIGILSSIDFQRNSSYLPYLLKDFCKYFNISVKDTLLFVGALQRFLDRDIKKEALSMNASNKLIILILDEFLLEYPFESTPFLSSKPVIRMPSLASVSRALIGSGKKISTPSISYLLNPDGSLRATEDRLSSFLLNNSHWKGIIGREPDAMEKADLASSDIFLYFGHGSGERYCRRDITSLSQMIVPSYVFLMGCSSAATKKYGLFEPTSTPVDYLLAGSDVVVGNLWDVTDKDIDRFALTALANWGLLKIPGISPCIPNGVLSLVQAVSKARSSCILQWAVGAAPVIWGLPKDTFNFV